MSNPNAIYVDKIVDLMRRFRTKTYRALQRCHDTYDDTILDSCIYLMKLDYECEIIDNFDGKLCEKYPRKIPIPINELGVGGKVVCKSPLSKLAAQAKAHKLDISSFKLESELEENSHEDVDTRNQSSSRRTLRFDDSSQRNEVNTIELENLSDLKFEDNNKVENVDADAAAAYNLDKCSLESSDNLSDSEDSDIHIKETDEQSASFYSFFNNLFPLNLGTSTTVQTSSEEASAEAEEYEGQDLKVFLEKYLDEAKIARCWNRFPVPCILFKEKFVCRSGTISGFMEITKKHCCPSLNSLEDFKQLLRRRRPACTYEDFKRGLNSLDKARKYDIKLLKRLDVSAIMDLMVEDKKIKYGIPCSSSEKTDKENRYADFHLFSIPYPGCEFFAQFTDNNMCSRDMHYDWDKSFNNATLSVPVDAISSKICTDWDSYKEWDLRTMTENYVKLILKYITEEDSMEKGILIHCISGWDRTPLFISLIRLSLWADGYIHSSLDAKQMLYFTLAYDWYLFGHKLPERLESKENILIFCFEFLEILGSETFMDVLERRERHPSNGSSAYDSATEGNETTESSSFGSVTSLASSSSSNPPSVAPSAPNIKVSSNTSNEAGVFWPFDKENGSPQNRFTFDGIAEHNQSVKLSTPGTKNTVSTKTFTKNSPSRSPLKEHNKGSPKAASSSSGKRVSVRRGALNGVLRELTPGKRSRKNSTSSRDGDRSFSESSNDSFVNVTDSDISVVNQLNAASNPVPVPGRRSRHNSSSSMGMGSWQLVGAEAIPHSFDSTKSCSRTPCAAEMIDSTHTIREEVSPSSSVGSSHSITVFNRRRRLAKVRRIFFDVDERRKRKEAEEKA